MAALPYSRALTVDDLTGVPDDGHRYELVDGALIVTPAPDGRHQIAVIGLLHAFEAAASDDLRVLVAPYEWRLGDNTALQPDVLVCTRDDVGAYHVVPPLVVAEVLSPSTRAFDLSVKRDRYEAAGVEAYWVVDPDVPSVTVWRRHEGAFAVVAHAEGDDEIVVDGGLPREVRLRPADLLR
jgi:Uma2 family endonuclease